VIVKCSVPLIDKPFTVPNVPVSEVKFMILNVLPMLGTKLVGRPMFKVPLRLAVVGFNWSYLPPAMVPLIEMSRVPEFWL